MQLQKDTKKEIEKLLDILTQESDEQIQYTEEELRKLAKKKKKKPKKPVLVFRQKRVHNFLSEKKIKAGENYFEAFILYYYFKDWCRTRRPKVTPVTYKRFTALLKIFLNKKFDRKEVLFFGISINLRKSYLTSNREAAIRRYHEKEITIPQREAAKKAIKAV